MTEMRDEDDISGNVLGIQFGDGESECCFSAADIRLFLFTRNVLSKVGKNACFYSHCDADKRHLVFKGSH